MQIDSDIIYTHDTGDDPKLNSLDIYFPPIKKTRSKKTVVIFIHGGSWTTGDKTFPAKSNNSIPHYFVNQGYIFVAINFRLAENYKLLKTTLPDVLLDIAKALKWLTINIRRYNGDTQHFILLGYSSGAHLASLLASDQSYLRSYNVNPAIIRAVISVDTAHFDIALMINKLRYSNTGMKQESLKIERLTKLIGKLPSVQNRLSPAHHIGPWVNDIRFLLLSAGRHFGQEQSLTLEMNKNFKDLLKANDIAASHYHFPKMDHLDFIDRFDAVIKEKISEFLRQS